MSRRPSTKLYSIGSDHSWYRRSGFSGKLIDIVNKLYSLLLIKESLTIIRLLYYSSHSMPAPIKSTRNDAIFSCYSRNIYRLLRTQVYNCLINCAHRSWDITCWSVVVVAYWAVHDVGLCTMWESLLGLIYMWKQTFRLETFAFYR